MSGSFSPALLATGNSDGFRYALEQAHLPGLIICGVLFLFSLFSWSVMISKWITLRRAERFDAAFRGDFRDSLEPLFLYEKGRRMKGSFLQALYFGGSREMAFQLLGSPDVDETFRARLQRAERVPFEKLRSVREVMTRSCSEAMMTLESRMGLLATAVSGAPFLGLLGTVWGVMETFSSIASGNGAASLQSMAPGVSSALVTTVVALLVAIPAMFGYNYIATSIKAKIREMSQFAGELSSAFERSYITAAGPTVIVSAGDGHGHGSAGAHAVSADQAPAAPPAAPRPVSVRLAPAPPEPIEHQMEINPIARQAAAAAASMPK